MNSCIVPSVTRNEGTLRPTIRIPFRRTGDDSGQDSKGDAGNEPVVTEAERGEERGHGDDGPDGEGRFLRP